jgi:hypothetical protein
MNYGTEYFQEQIFESDYASIAALISKIYRPAKVIEFGCGPGHLTRELGKLNIAVDAIDGFSDPDLGGYPNITFSKIDLNDAQQLGDYLKGKSYDLAVCTEVAEHLDPASSEHLIKYLTASAPVVVFSAAVPEQNGHGHINCRPRELWHDLFSKHNFQLADSLREQLRSNSHLAMWYKLNIVDYVSADRESPLDPQQVIRNLLASESYSSSLFYQVNNENTKNVAYLNYPLVKQYFGFRNFLKKLVKK